MEKIVITGANRGIGLELTKLFLCADKHVVATCRNPEASIELQDLADAGRLNVFQLEVTDSDSITNFCDSLAGQLLMFSLIMLASWVASGEVLMIWTMMLGSKHSV